MCGIFGYAGTKKDAAEIVFSGIRSLEYRGYDSWGVGVVPASKSKFLISPLAVKKQVGKIGQASIADLPQGSIAFGHPRWATHGGATVENAHPHLDCTKRFAVIHNGIIENYEMVRDKILRKKHTFRSQTDTEVVVHLIEELAQTQSLRQATRQAFNLIEGLNAFIVLDSQTKQLIAVRNGSPLVVGFGRGENFLASDASALLPYTKRVHFMEDNEMVIITDSQTEFFETKSGKKLKPLIQTLNWSFAQADLGKFPHFMLKEIYEQPKILSNISQVSTVEIKKIAGLIETAFGTYLVGCGTAAYACLAGSYLFSKVSGFHLNLAIMSEFGYQLDFLTPKSLVLALSQSGETMDILESVKKAKAKGAKIVSLVNVFGSSLYRLSDYSLLMGAGSEKAVASTKDFTAKLAHLTLLAYALKGKIKDGQKVVAQAAKVAAGICQRPDLSRLKKLAKLLKHKDHMYIIGRGLSYPAALETALKIKEISYIHAEGLPAGELKHGPLALVEKGTPCLAFLPGDETYGANLAGSMEMKARGGYLIGISYKPHEIFDYYIPVADCREATIIPNVVVAQLLAYYLAIERGLDPDKPRHLAKSV